ncbi:hypothetical protein KL86CLO1_11668 [uncultured Eubacteriales bacterium]|uniref:Uncharacterized protein n=1 Tax=uncultured Eubacteriales bacterium TaxID=172733 RepID=A0A212JTE4_9FIRM|nr:hypothetical protein KL86CLO1_11668 [uncultured Eubacteriales bacterium]
MTKDQKIEMFSLRLEGKTFEEIATRFGCIRQYVHQVISGKDKKVAIKVDQIIFPGIRNWMVENHTRIAALARVAGLSPSCLYTSLTAKSNGGMNMETCRRLLSVTGLTFEEAFGTCDP